MVSRVLSNLAGFLIEQGKIGDFNRGELQGRNPKTMPYSIESLDHDGCKTVAVIGGMRVRTEYNKALEDSQKLTTVQIQFMDARQNECFRLLENDPATPETLNLLSDLENYSTMLATTGVQNILRFISENPKLKAELEAEEETARK